MNQEQGATNAAPTNTGDATGGVIPYKNFPALVAYYCGVFSIIPCLGLPLGLVAFVCGILGLKKAAQMPAVKGTVHAWIGIIAGGLMMLIYAALGLFWMLKALL
jgi:hypothetical protein